MQCRLCAGRWQPEIARAAVFSPRPQRAERPPPDPAIADRTARRAAEIARLNAATPWTYRPVADWIAQGADPELDILPTVRRVVARAGYKPPGSLGYFARPVLEAMAERRARDAPPPEVPRWRRHWQNLVIQGRDAEADALLARHQPEPQRATA
jgi:hypothetical protein